MPYNKRLAGLPTPTYAEQIQALFRFAGLKDLQTVLPAQVPKGSRLHYPPLLSYGVAVVARLYGSQRRALIELSSRGVWDSVCIDYCALLGVPDTLPAAPPTLAHQDNFYDWLVEDAQRLPELSAAFTASAIGQARHQGNFPDDAGAPDWTKPDPRHLVFGDGTVYKPYSRVVEVVDKATGEMHLLHSRARKGSPRVQRRLTDLRPDGKHDKMTGVNHVTTSTWTRSGWVVLTNDQAPGAEVKIARRQIRRLHDVLGDRLHTVVWDGAVTGHDIERLFASRRVLVMNKPRARSTDKMSGYTPARLAQRDAEDLFRRGQPLPLGTAVHPTTEGVEVVRSMFRQYGLWTGDGCSHELWVDDGALVIVEKDPATHHLYKTATAVANEAAPLPSYTGFHLTISWDLTCSAGRRHKIRTRWQPRRHSGQQQDQRAESLDLLRPIPRGDERFNSVYGLRNSTESYHSWIKGRLGTGVSTRAVHLDTDKQYLDHLCAGTLANALSAYRDWLLGGARAAA